jgi:A/G-specific adenine glycosylase
MEPQNIHSKNLIKFRAALIQWNTQNNHRALPWKAENDPYKIWLSEVLLQQTRAEQAYSYYIKFIQTFPTIKELANAEEEVVFRLWQGLGYYSRCRNMITTAKFIAHELNGIFPNNYEAILQLKGVGAYTAAAISSFAFKLPYAVLDGNVYRVLARYFGIETPIDSNNGKKEFQHLAQLLLDTKQPHIYNQSIMDFGATVCTPKLPNCDNCPLQKSCVANHQQLTTILPIKEKKIKTTVRYFNYFLFLHSNQIWIHKRAEKDIWQNLYEFYNIETSASLNNDIEGALEKLPKNLKNLPIKFFKSNKQKLTHQLIHTSFFVVQCSTKPNSLLQKGIWINVAQLNDYPFPKTITTLFPLKPFLLFEIS